MTLAVARRAAGAGRRRPAAHPAADASRAARRRRCSAASAACCTRRSASASTQRAPAAAWAGTFHGVGARLLREYAPQIGLAENFTIHDRGDAEDLMGLVRHELRLRDDAEPLPAEGHLPGDLLARASTAASRSARCCATSTRGARLGGRAEAAVPRLRGRQAGSSTCSTTTTCCCTGAQMLAEPALARHDRRALRPRAGRRVPGHQPPAGRDPARAEARRPRPDGGRRRRAVDLLVPRRRGAQHPRLPGAVRRRRRASSRWSATTARRSRSSTPRTP